MGVLGVAAVAALCGACRLGFDATASDASARLCAIPSELGSTGALTSPRARRYDETIQQGKVHRVSGSLEADPSITIKLELWDGYGVFAGGSARVGTFPLEGAETSAATCGVCAYVSWRSSNVGESDSKQTLLGIMGAVTVTELGGPGTAVTADLQDIDFVEIDPATSERVPDGCTTSIAAANLSGTLQTESDGVGGDSGHGGDGDSGDSD